MKAEYKIADVVKAMGGKLLSKEKRETVINELLLDSRKLIHPAQTLFFALGGQKLDGHNYIDDLYKRGVRNFVVAKEPDIEKYTEANFIVVKDVLAALQKLAGFHRGKFTMPVIAVTGSNGKTIVKEWLYQLLHEDYNIVRNPKSYNSQVGVPLSLWLINSENTLGIFEAGISEPGEMPKLQKIIQPTIGVFTNIGEAHSAGFLNIKHKTKEKLTLFTKSEVLIYCKDYPDINQSLGEINALRDEPVKIMSWSMSGEPRRPPKSDTRLACKRRHSPWAGSAGGFAAPAPAGVLCGFSCLVAGINSGAGTPMAWAMPASANPPWIVPGGAAANSTLRWAASMIGATIRCRSPNGCAGRPMSAKLRN